MNTQRGGFALGLIVGLLAGLALALAVALYITKAPVPFVNKVQSRSAEQDAAEAARNKDWDPNAPLTGKVVPRAGGSVAVQATGPATTAPASAPPAATRNPAAILEARTAPTAAAPARPASGADAMVYFVQAGAYVRADDADQQRAKLAMLGLDARVTEREQSGRTIFRVRLGPFERRDEAESAQARLSDARVESNLVRAER